MDHGDDAFTLTAVNREAMCVMGFLFDILDKIEDGGRVVLAKIGSLISGKKISATEPRADMYLPFWLLVLSLVLFICTVIAGCGFISDISTGSTICACICFVVGVAALLCWRNQQIVMISEDAFEYTTFLGHKYVYQFSEITDLKERNDSMTLLVGKKRVHIESCAILSDRFVKRVNHELCRED